MLTETSLFYYDTAPVQFQLHHVLMIKIVGGSLLARCSSTHRLLHSNPGALTPHRYTMDSTAAPMSAQERQAYCRMSETMEYFVRR